MAEFTTRNRTQLSVIIIILWILITAIDNWIEKESSTTIQWIALGIAVVCLIYVNFISVVEDVDIEEEYYVPNIKDISKMSLQEQAAHELEFQDKLEKGELVLVNTEGEHVKESSADIAKLHAGWKPNPDGSATKTVFIMQPIRAGM